MATSGIGAIKNIDNNKIFAFKSKNLEKLSEIYQVQLDLNIHHNKPLQEDWNIFDKDNFEFIIIEEIDEDFLEDEFVDYISHLDNSYNDFNFDSYYFEYLEQSNLIKLYDIIGRYECRQEFLEKLENYDLSIDMYFELKDEMISLINSSHINEDEIEEKLDELILEKSYQIRVLNLDMQFKLMNDLEEIIGIAELNEDFIHKLNENGLSKLMGFSIQEKIMEMIFSNNVVDNNIEKQIDSCIEILKEKISQEVIDKLLDEADNLENDEEFINKLDDSNLSIDTGLKIINQFKELILSGAISEETFSQELDDLIDVEIENQWLETKQELLTYLDTKIDSQELINKLESNHVDVSKLSKMKIYIQNSIENKKITSKIEIGQQIESLTDEEILKVNTLKEELLSYLSNTYGGEELSSQFKNEINDAQLSVDDGNEFISQVSNDISSFKVKSIDEIDEFIEKSILDRNKSILTNSVYDLVGKEKNNYSFSQKLKLNYLAEKDGNKIRDELLIFINDTKLLQELIDLRNNLENKLDEIIKREGELNHNKLIKLSNELIELLNNLIGSPQINDSFKKRLYAHNLGEEYGVKIRNELTQIIQNNQNGLNFELKMDQLKTFKNEGIDVVVNAMIEKEAAIRSEEYILLKSDLLKQLNDLIGPIENNNYFEELLIENNLSSDASQNIRNDFNEIIDSDEVYDIVNFSFKYEELVSVKNKSIKTLLFELIQKQKDIYDDKLKEKRDYLIDLVNATIGENNIELSFINKLKSFNLQEGSAFEIKRDLIDLINSDDVSENQYKFKLDELIALEENGIDLKIDELINLEVERRTSILKENLLNELYHVTGDIPLSEEFIAKLNNSYFDEEYGMKLVNHFESEINSLRIEEGFDFEKAIDDMMYDESRNILIEQTYGILGKETDSEFFTNTLKNNMISTNMAEDIKLELFNMIDEADLNGLTELRKVTMKNKFDEIILREHTSRTNKLNEIRDKLLTDLNNFISDSSFKNILRNNNLSIECKDKIKNEIENLINSDDVEGDFEFKLDELIDLDEKGINNKINEIVKKESDIINEKFNELQDELLSDLTRYIWPLYTPKFASIELDKRNLSISTGKKAYDKLKNIITSDNIIDLKFISKYDELMDLKNITVKTKFIEIIEDYSINQEKLINYLHSQTIENSSFKQQLRLFNLGDDFVEILIKKIEVKIKDSEYIYNLQINQAINNYIKEEAAEQEKALNTLYDVVGRRGISLKFRAKLIINSLSTDDGKRIIKIVEDKIKTEKLRSINVNNEINRQIKQFTRNNGSSGQKHVFCMKCGHKNTNGSNFCTKCGARLPKL